MSRRSRRLSQMKLDIRPKPCYLCGTLCNKRAISQRDTEKTQRATEKNSMAGLFVHVSSLRRSAKSAGNKTLPKKQKVSPLLHREKTYSPAHNYQKRIMRDADAAYGMSRQDYLSRSVLSEIEYAGCRRAAYVGIP